MTEILTLNISGMDEGGYPDYEQHCQIMLQTGLEYVQSVDYEFDIENKEHRDLLERCISQKHSDCSGYQMGSVLSHVLYIVKQGYDIWLAENPDRHLMVNEELFPSEWVGVIKCFKECEFAKPLAERRWSDAIIHCEKVNKDCMVEGRLLFCHAKLKED